MNHFIKHNHTSHPQSLLTEAKGLKLLKHWIELAEAALCVPDIITVNQQQLSMTYIESKQSTAALQRQLGHALAVFHNKENKHCGLAYDNFIGLNPQINCEGTDWGHFFWQYRLKYQVDLIQVHEIRQNFTDILNQSKLRLTHWLNQNYHHFSLLHGDLWSGNVLFDAEKVWLIDPAVYFGDSEADLAMTELFGGFSSDFYQAYQSVKPLSKTYPTKRTIYNLYHYLNHYNLFGSGYLSSCKKGFEVIANL